MSISAKPCILQVISRSLLQAQLSTAVGTNPTQCCTLNSAQVLIGTLSCISFFPFKLSCSWTLHYLQFVILILRFVIQIHLNLHIFTHTYMHSYIFLSVTISCQYSTVFLDRLCSLWVCYRVASANICRFSS